MGMFETTGAAASAAAARKTIRCKKLTRLKKALRHEEPDRVPISDFFWGSFIRRWREELGPAGRRQSVLLLRPRLDRHGAQHGPLDPLVRDARGDARRGRGEDRLRRDPAQGVQIAPCPSSSPGRLDTLEKLEAAGFDDPRDRGGSLRRATTRLPAWATVSSGIRRPGSRRSSRCGPISPSTAAWASAPSA